MFPTRARLTSLLRHRRLAQFASTSTQPQLTQQENTFTPKVIPTVPASLHHHLFASAPPPTTVEQDPYATLELPQLKAPSLHEHFALVAGEQCAVYDRLLSSTLDWRPEDVERPEQWTLQTGWTRYADGKAEQVPYPLEDVFYFDVEVCVRDGALPTMAVALSDKAWYSWCSDRLVNDSPVPSYATLDHLIPLGEERERVAIGHNIGYDRVRSREPYGDKPSLLRFWCTMSAHIPIWGMPDHLRLLYDKRDTGVEEMRMGWLDDWRDRVSKNSLAAVYAMQRRLAEQRGDDETKWFSLQKSDQKTFVVEDMDYIREHAQSLMTYCANDVLATAQIHRPIWREFKKRFPHPASLEGTLAIGEAYLPVNHNWPLFYTHNDQRVAEKKNAAARQLAEHTRELANSPHAARDPWLWMENWSRCKKDVVTWQYSLYRNKKSARLPLDQLTIEEVKMSPTTSILPKIFGLMYGPYPMMHKRDSGWGFIVPKNDKPSKAAANPQVQLHNGDSVEFPADLIRELVRSSRREHGDIDLPDSRPVALTKGFDFYRLPHPSGKNENVGSPLSKDFRKNEMKSGVIRATRYTDTFSRINETLEETVFWGNYSERFAEELVVWKEPMELGVIAPAVAPSGTVSRRSVHKLWVTATNAKDAGRIIGTGLKSMVQAPPGHRLVGADVDSQEQWLAGVFGDAADAVGLPDCERRAGRTPFSNMMLAGQKSDGSDLHTVVAKQLNISRDQAKVLNYARLYGAGEQNASDSLQQAGMSEQQAEATAANLMKITKGVVMGYRELTGDAARLLEEYLVESGADTGQIRFMGRHYLPDYDSERGSSTTSFEDWVVGKARAVRPDISPEQIIPLLYADYAKAMKLYRDGFESATFNFLELSSLDPQLRTPVLGGALGDSLSPLPDGVPDREHFAKKYRRSVMNWVVQSSAVDFLHLLMVCMKWLCRENDIPARFVISIHDEIRYLCREEDAARCALALMLSNMYVRAFISTRLGIQQLPSTIAFFSQVDCDTVLRKEVFTKCANPDGTPVPDGVAWDMEAILKLTGGSLKKK